MNIPLNIDWQQILLHLFNFAILAAGLYLLLYKPVKEFMDKRTDYYQKLDAEAKKNIQDAEGMKVDYENRLTLTEQEIAEKKTEADRELEQMKQQKLQEATEEAARIVSEARGKAKKEKEKLLADAGEQIADTAISAAKKLVKDTISQEQEKALFEDILKKAGESGGN
jgi:F-type H+-transporting ATPase subunit b